MDVATDSDRRENMLYVGLLDKDFNCLCTYLLHNGLRDELASLDIVDNSAVSTVRIDAKVKSAATQVCGADRQTYWSRSSIEACSFL